VADIAQRAFTFYLYNAEAFSTTGALVLSNQVPALMLPCCCSTVRAGEKGTGRSGKPLHFKGSTFHRVITEVGAAAV
jgi:hypothetical protein